MLLIGTVSLVVGILKANTAHSCPWDLIEYGGKAMPSAIRRGIGTAGPR